MSIKSRIKAAIKGRLLSLAYRSSWYDELFPECKKFWDHREFDLDVVNLGSTSGLNAFNYSGLAVRAANWAMPRNSLKGDLAILENYSSYLRKGAVVIIPLCPFSSLSGSYDCSEDRYYTILSPRSLSGFSRRRLERILAIKNSPLRYIPFVEFIREIKRLIIPRSNARIAPINMEEDAQSWIDGWQKEFCVKDFSYPLSLVNEDGVHDAVQILNRMIAFCKVHGFRPVLTIPPMHRSLAEKFTPQMQDVLLGSLEKRINGVSIMNFMDNPEFSLDDSLFANSFLLNKIGAEKFTRKLLRQIGFDI